MSIKYIAIEGGEGAGKSTAIETIKKFFSEMEIFNTREPGGTKMAEDLRKIVKDEEGEYSDENVDLTTEILLFFASRNQSLNNEIKPQLDNNKLVISDRCFLSSVAYQGAGGANKELLASLSEHALSIKPDLIIYMDIDPVIGFTRVDSRGERDRIEQKNIEYFKDVRKEYLRYAENHSNVITIDASQSLENVQKQIISALKERI
jgi:dTMP kinase